MTDPVHGEPQIMVALLPGFTETIEGTIYKKLHDDVSYAHPDSRIVPSIDSSETGIRLLKLWPIAPGVQLQDLLRGT